MKKLFGLSLIITTITFAMEQPYPELKEDTDPNQAKDLRIQIVQPIQSVGQMMPSSGSNSLIIQGGNRAQVEQISALLSSHDLSEVVDPHAPAGSSPFDFNKLLPLLAQTRSEQIAGDDEKGPFQFSTGSARVNPAEFVSKLKVGLGDPGANDWVKKFLAFHVKRAYEGKKEGHKDFKGRTVNMKGQDLHQLYEKNKGLDPEQVSFPEEWIQRPKKEVPSQPIDAQNATIEFSVRGKKKFEFILAYMKANEARFRDPQYGFKLNEFDRLYHEAHEEAKDIQEDDSDANNVYAAAIKPQKPRSMLAFQPTEGEPIHLNLDDFDKFKHAFHTVIQDEGLLRFIFDSIRQRMAQSDQEGQLDIQELINLYMKQQLEDPLVNN